VERQIADVINVAWKAYDEYQKSPRTRLPQGGIDRYVGYYEPYATSHQALDRDTEVQQEVRHAAKALIEVVPLARAGRLPHPGERDARPK
jgi:hypothetical protein